MMVDELIKYDLSLDVYFTYGPAANVLSRPVLPRRDGQPIFMRGEVGVKGDGQLRPLVAHNTTHIDMPVHFLEGAADLHTVLNNPAYRVNLPLLARVVDVSAWPDPQYLYENNGMRYCELVTAEMLPSVDELRAYDALVLLTGFGAVMRCGSEQYTPDTEGFFPHAWGHSRGGSAGGRGRSDAARHRQPHCRAPDTGQSAAHDRRCASDSSSDIPHRCSSWRPSLAISLAPQVGLCSHGGDARGDPSTSQCKRGRRGAGTGVPELLSGAE